MSRTSALTRKPKGLGRRNFAQGYPRSHATPTPRSKGQKSRSAGAVAYYGGHLAAQLVSVQFVNYASSLVTSGIQYCCQNLLPARASPQTPWVFSNTNASQLCLLFKVIIKILFIKKSGKSQRLSMLQGFHSYQISSKLRRSSDIQFQRGSCAALYYFRFRFDDVTIFRWSLKIYPQTKFRRHILIHSRDITTSGLKKQTSAIFEFYFRFQFLLNCIIGWLFCISLPNFTQIGPYAAVIWRHINFQDGGRQPCLICFGVMVDHPQNVFCGLSSMFVCLIDVYRHF